MATIIEGATGSAPKTMRKLKIVRSNSTNIATSPLHFIFLTSFGFSSPLAFILVFVLTSQLALQASLTLSFLLKLTDQPKPGFC